MDNNRGMFSPRIWCWRAVAALSVLGLIPWTLYATPPGTNRHVILITIDGLSASYLSDPKAPIPTLKKLAEEGASAEAMRVSNPSVTWPNHTTLVTGVHPDKHSVFFNGALIRRGDGAPVYLASNRDKKDLVATSTVYDLLHEAGYRTAAINWPCTRRAAALDDNFPDVPDPVDYISPRLRVELIHNRILENSSNAALRSKSPATADKIWTSTAVHLIKTRPPNLLLLHLLNTDAVQHTRGPNLPEAYAAIGLADSNVAEVLSAVGAAGLRKQTTVIVASDHGFAQTKKLISPNVLFRKAGLQRGSPKHRAHVISEGGTAFVFLTQTSTRTQDRIKALNLLREHEGIERIVQPDDYPALHLPHPDKNPQMSDLILVAKDGYAFSDDSFEDESITEVTFSAGSHGYLADNPRMNGVFIVSGCGIKPKVKLGLIENIDVSPTIAEIFGEKFSSMDGKVLWEIFSNRMRP